MSVHANLTGADLHELKGAAAAAANTVPVANGAGSTTFQKLTSGSIDTTSIFTTNLIRYAVRFPDVGAVSTVYVPVPAAATFNSAYITVQAALTGANSILTFANHASAVIGTSTLTFAASAAGDTFSFTASVNNTFTAGQLLRITSDGGATNSVEAIVVLTFTQTA